MSLPIIHVVAGNLGQATNFVRSLNEIVPVRMRYINGVEGIQGLDRGTSIHLVGTYKDNKRWREISQAMRERECVRIYPED